MFAVLTVLATFTPAADPPPPPATNPTTPGPVAPQGPPPLRPAVHLAWDLWKAAEGPDAEAGKAVEAMAKAGFVFAEASAGGAAWGHNGTCRVVIASLPIDPGVPFSLLMVASRDKLEASRIRDAIRNHMRDARHNAQSPRTLGTRDPQKEAKLLALDWHAEIRAANPISRHTPQVAAVVLEKRGFKMEAAPSGLAFGTKASSEANMQVVMALAANGPVGTSTLHLVFSAGTDAAATAGISKQICVAILKVLYE